MNYPVFWIFGLSGSGKSTLSNLILKEFPQIKYIDNDILKKKFKKSFDKETRVKTVDNLRLLALEESKKYPILINKITPYEEMRSRNRKLLPNYYEIYLRCPIEEVIKRDVKGLYKKAKMGQIHHMIGISKHIDDIFEEPNNSDIIIDTTKSIEYSFNIIKSFIILKL